MASFFCGLDFGTARSGYGYMAFNDSSVKVKDGWPGEPPGVPYPKTLTALLYKKQTWQVVAWGWEAFNRYQTMDKADQPKYHFLKNFKLSLADGDKQLKLPSGLTPVRCISDFLKCIMDDFDRQMKMAYAEKYDRSKVQFSMTVPAGWSDLAKEVMREAAVQSGMVPGAEAKSRLRFLHEPEAAMLAALNNKAISLNEGDTVMIIDAGGGTIDITMHMIKFRADGQMELHEVTRKEMETKGSTFIDERFEERVKGLITSEVFSTWVSKQPGEELKLLSNWEVKKRAHTMMSAREIEVAMPMTLQKAMPKAIKNRLGDAQDGEDEKIVLKATHMNELFDESVNATTSAAEKVMARAPSYPTFIFLVGGFGSSPYLVARVKAAFRDKVPETNILAPHNAASAIMEGAVHNAQRPQTLASRVATLTYGLKVTLPRNRWPGDPPPHATVVEFNGDKYCNDCFLKLITIGDSVETGQGKSTTVVPQSKDGDQMEMSIYSSKDPNPMFTCEPGVKKVGEVILKGLQEGGLRQAKTVQDYKVELTVLFGEATLSAVARDKQTGMSVQTDIRIGQ